MKYLHGASMANQTRKALIFCGAMQKVIRDLPKAVKENFGHQMDLVQQGLSPTDWKPVPRVGPGVMEIRIWNDDGTYRVLYVAKFEEAVYVLHIFKKKTEKISKTDIDFAKDNYKNIS